MVHNRLLITHTLCNIIRYNRPHRQTDLSRVSYEGGIKVQHFDTSFDTRHLHIAIVLNYSDSSEIYSILSYMSFFQI